jgi:hypothetical protein
MHRAIPAGAAYLISGIFHSCGFQGSEAIFFYKYDAPAELFIVVYLSVINYVVSIRNFNIKLVQN